MSYAERNDLIERGRRVLALEAKAIAQVAERLGPGFAAAVRLLAGAKGRLIVSGVGKSGIIARKIAATLTSTGSPASFLHAVDSLHGDLGIVGRDDAAILLSKSGSSDELFGLVSQLKRLGVPMIAITGDAESALARQADVVLDSSVAEEACPETLAPTASTAAALALGDALAVTLLEEKGFRREDFAAPGRHARPQPAAARRRRDGHEGPADPLSGVPHAAVRHAAGTQARHGRGGGSGGEPRRRGDGGRPHPPDGADG